MSSTKQKLHIAGAFAALATLALAVSCKGFFVPEQLASMTISPASPTVPLGGSTQLEAFGTNTDSSSAGNISSKVTWSSSGGGITVSGSGLLTGTDLSSAAATITAVDQGITATASATVCVENGTNFTMTFSPGNTVDSDTAVTVGVTADVSGVSGPQDVTAGVTWSSTNSAVSITAGDPASIDLTGLTTSGAVAILGTYTCNGVNTNFQANLTVTVAPTT
jgi:Bacterial Ig-like domain (group 2)